MLHSTDYREIRNGKHYQTSIERIISNHGSTEEIANGLSSENIEGDIPEFQTLTQEAFNEQIRGFIDPPTRQLEELTRLLQGMTTSRHPHSYPRTELGATSGMAMPQSDTLRVRFFQSLSNQSIFVADVLKKIAKSMKFRLLKEVQYLQSLQLVQEISRVLEFNSLGNNS